MSFNSTLSKLFGHTSECVCKNTHTDIAHKLHRSGYVCVYVCCRRHPNTGGIERSGCFASRVTNNVAREKERMFLLVGMMTSKRGETNDAPRRGGEGGEIHGNAGGNDGHNSRLPSALLSRSGSELSAEFSLQRTSTKLVANRRTAIRDGRPIQCGNLIEKVSIQHDCATGLCFPSVARCLWVHRLQSSVVSGDWKRRYLGALVCWVRN